MVIMTVIARQEVVLVLTKARFRARLIFGLSGCRSQHESNLILLTYQSGRRASFMKAQFSTAIVGGFKQ